MPNRIDPEIDAAFESVFEVAMEAHTIDPAIRAKLPDSCFGVVTEEDGKPVRAYPLKVPGDKAKTAELCSKAIQMFHYCKSNRKPILAKSILSTIKSEKVTLTISSRNQIFKYVSPSDFPKCVTIKDASASK